MGELDGTELVFWRELPPRQRREWWEDAWNAAISLSARYRLALRRGWWEDAIQVEAIAAFHAWLRLYDTGAYTDPPGKLQLLWELERLRAVIRAGEATFDPVADRTSFELYLDTVENKPKPATNSKAAADAQLAAELAAVTQRTAELRQRAALLRDRPSPSIHGPDDADHSDRESNQISAALAELTARERELRRALESEPGSALQS
jgi:hypothetical protein